MKLLQNRHIHLILLLAAETLYFFLFIFCVQLFIFLSFGSGAGADNFSPYGDIISAFLLISIPTGFNIIKFNRHKAAGNKNKAANYIVAQALSTMLFLWWLW